MTKAKTTYDTFKSKFGKIDIEFTKHSLDRISQIKKDSFYIRGRIESGNVFKTDTGKIGVVNGHYIIIGKIIGEKVKKDSFLVITIINKNLRKLYEKEQ